MDLTVGSFTIRGSKSIQPMDDFPRYPLFCGKQMKRVKHFKTLYASTKTRPESLWQYRILQDGHLGASSRGISIPKPASSSTRRMDHRSGDIEMKMRLIHENARLMQCLQVVALWLWRGGRGAMTVWMKIFVLSAAYYT